MALNPSSRRLRGLAVAACAAVALPVVAATPAAAQTTSELSGATQASAISITLNLPQENRVQLLLDPVAGTVRSAGGSPEAQALAALLAGSIGDNAQSLGADEATLPEPKATACPAEPLNDGIADSPLAAFLAVELLDCEAAVTEAPSSQSHARIASLGVGLPQELVDGLAPVLDGIRGGVQQLLLGLADGTEEGVQQLCAGLAPAGQLTEPLVEGLQPIPGVGTLAEELLGGVSEGDVALLCALNDLLREFNDKLQASLSSLAGPGGILGTGLIEARQSVTTSGADIAAEAEASVAGLTVLGQDAFAEAEALTTRSFAALSGGQATAEVDAAAVEVLADPLAEVRTDLRELTGEVLTIDLAGVNEIVQELQALIDALLGIGIDAGRLGSPDDAIETCPTELGGLLSGTFEAADATCAAAAARGYGLAVTLPEGLAGPLGIGTDPATGQALPFVELRIVPTAAVVRSLAPAPVAGPGPAPTASGPLPRTGAEAPLAAAGVALLLGAALVRRRRLAAEV